MSYPSIPLVITLGYRCAVLFIHLYLFILPSGGPAGRYPAGQSIIVVLISSVTPAGGYHSCGGLRCSCRVEHYQPLVLIFIMCGST